MTQMILGASNANPPASASFAGIQGVTYWFTNATNEGMDIVPYAGTFSKLRVAVDTAPGAGKSLTFTLRKNGVNQTLTVAISGTNTTGVDTTHTVSFAAGDRVSLGCVPAGTPTLSLVRWALEFDGSGLSIIMGSPINSVAPGVGYYPLMSGILNTGASESNYYCVIPTAGTLKNLYARITGATANDDLPFRVRLNGSNTTLVATVPWKGTNGSDTTHTVSVVAGDLVTLSISAPTGFFYPWWGVAFQPASAGESIILQSPYYSPTNLYVQFLCASGQATWLNLPSEAGRYQITNAMTVGKLYAYAAAAPGADKSFVYTLRKNGAATAMFAKVTGTATKSVSAGTLALADADLLTLYFNTEGAPPPTIQYSSWALVKDPVGVLQGRSFGTVLG